MVENVRGIRALVNRWIPFQTSSLLCLRAGGGEGGGWEEEEEEKREITSWPDVNILSRGLSMIVIIKLEFFLSFVRSRVPSSILFLLL